jgi:ubiquinone/menaquinone biosynthesis C-methylase UbiE
MTQTGSERATALYASSAGLALSGSNWLDGHFAMCQPEYEDMLQSAGFQPGWSVLDAGCGPGSYFPKLAEMLGASGSIHGIDLAPESVEIARMRVEEWQLPCNVVLQQGSLLDLPYADGQFDAVWFSSTAQYFSDSDLELILQEFRRVVRPGGLIAVKDYDCCLERRPGNQAIRWRILDTKAHQDSAISTQIQGWMRTGLLKRWLERAGLEDVWQKSVPIERWAPLAPADRSFLTMVLARSIDEVADVNLPDEDLAYLRTQEDATSPEHALNDPEFHYCETHVVAVGRVPAG